MRVAAFSIFSFRSATAWKIWRKPSGALAPVQPFSFRIGPTLDHSNSVTCAVMPRQRTRISSMNTPKGCIACSFVAARAVSHGIALLGMGWVSAEPRCASWSGQRAVTPFTGTPTRESTNAHVPGWAGELRGAGNVCPANSYFDPIPPATGCLRCRCSGGGGGSSDSGSVGGYIAVEGGDMDDMSVMRVWMRRALTAA